MPRRPPVQRGQQHGGASPSIRGRPGAPARPRPPARAPSGPAGREREREGGAPGRGASGGGGGGGGGGLARPPTSGSGDQGQSRGPSRIDAAVRIWRVTAPGGRDIRAAPKTRSAASPGSLEQDATAGVQRGVRKCAGAMAALAARRAASCWRGRVRTVQLPQAILHGKVVMAAGSNATRVHFRRGCSSRPPRDQAWRIHQFRALGITHAGKTWGLVSSRSSAMSRPCCRPTTPFFENCFDSAPVTLSAALVFTRTKVV